MDRPKRRTHVTQNNTHDPARDVVDRILSRAGTALTSEGRGDEETHLDAEERTSLRRVGLSTEL
ncbi:MAG: GTPase HflX, partial [bacterium]|nr:GTPase HflX [bacterium]